MHITHRDEYFTLTNKYDKTEEKHQFCSAAVAVKWLKTVRPDAKEKNIRSLLYRCIGGKLKSLYGYAFSLGITMPMYSTMPAIRSIEVETCYDLWISISKSYIMITTKASKDIDWQSDYEIEQYVRGFDRLDGEDYYKTYELPWIVDLITSLIKDLNL